MNSLTPAAATAPKVSLEALLKAEMAGEAAADSPQTVGISASATRSGEEATELDKASKATKTSKATKAPKPDNAPVDSKDAKPKPKGKAVMSMERFGLTNEAQWLLNVPARFEDYKTFTDDFNALYQGTVAMVRGRIESKKLFDDQKNETTNLNVASRLMASIVNKRGQRLWLTAFGRPGYGWKGHEKGGEIIVRGMPKINERNGGMELTQTEVVRTSDLGKIIPIYPPIRGTKGERFAEKVHGHRHLMESAAQLLAMETGWGARGLNEVLSEVTQFSGPQALLSQLHSPTSLDEGHKAQRAGKFLSAWTLIRKTNLRLASVEANPKSIINIDLDVVEDLKKRIPFDLTTDQRLAIDGICKSLKSPMPMTGLLSGDVGSGKTLSFLVPMVAAHRAGKRVMLMTPNLLLITQISMDLEAFFPEIGVCVVTGKKGKKGGVVGDPLKDIIVGTSALLGAMKKGELGALPDFIVVDEQHKFSVEQREAMIGAHTNSLEATATPIPRTAALATHGAKDLFLLHQIPVEKTIVSKIMGRDQAREARNVVLEALLNRGEQAAVIYPIVETDDPAKVLKSVAEAAANWSRKVPMEQIAVLHGRMKDDEKNEVLDSFRRGEKRLLLSSTVVEVGVTLPELKTMLLIGADAFGVVTLHQLRGRLARHGGSGEFIMFTENLEPDARERLALLVAHQDGFLLAEKDAESRGYGDVLGIDGDMQSGKTRTVFLGVNIGPKHISFAANLHEKFVTIERANMAAEVANLATRSGESLRLL